MRSSCPNCAGSMQGDGYHTPFHCENVDIDKMFLEPDCNPVYCALNLPRTDINRPDPKDRRGIPEDAQ